MQFNLIWKLLLVSMMFQIPAWLHKFFIAWMKMQFKDLIH